MRLRLASTSVTWLLVVACLSARADDRPRSVGAYRVSLDRGHPWRPPFGLDRVGSPPAVVVHSPDRPSGAALILGVFKGGKEIGRQTVRFPEKPPYSARVSIPGDADEVVLLDASCEALASSWPAPRSSSPALEADAVARPDSIVNPVDLGTILVPSGWLLLGPGQSAMLDVAAISRDRDRPDAAVDGLVSIPGRIGRRPPRSASRRARSAGIR